MKDLIHSKNNAMYSTISEYLIQSIYEGKYENEKFPSIRKAAEIFNVSIITIKSAYQILEKLDIIVANPKTGYIISEDAKDKILEMKKEELKQLIFKAESIYNQYSISFFDLI